MNIRRLQNGIGAASVLGIVVILSSVALDPGSPATSPSPTDAVGSTTPLTSTGNGAPDSGMSTEPASTTAPSPTSTRSPSGAPKPPTHTNVGTRTLPNADGTTPSTIPNNAPQVATALKATTSDPAPSGTLAPASTTRQSPVRLKVRPRRLQRHRRRQSQLDWSVESLSLSVLGASWAAPTWRLVCMT